MSDGKGKTVRIDKFLWSVRIYKTRSQATEACRNGRVSIDGIPAKASREVKEGDVIVFRQSGIHRKIRILDILQNRVGAKLVPDFIEDITDEKELEKLKMIREMNSEKRERGTGRPSKKDRRDIERLKGF